jgi:hypothetical protein
MSIDEQPPLKKRTGIVVILAIVGIAWYGVSHGWFDFGSPSIEVESPATNVSQPAEREQDRAGLPSEVKIAKEPTNTNTE